MEWITKIPDLAKLPTKYFALISLVSGSLLLLPTSVLARLHLDSIPPPYGAIVGVVFLITTGLVVVNALSWVWNRIDAKRRKSKRDDALLEMLMSLDHAEQSVLREFYITGQSTIKMPMDTPTVAGLVSHGILQRVGTLGNYSLHGMMFSLRIAKTAQEMITPDILGLSEFQIPTDDGQLMMNDEGIEWIGKNRPEFTGPRRMSGW